MKTDIFFYGHGFSLLNIFGHPYFLARYEICRAFASNTLFDLSRKKNILDVGCGNLPYRNLFSPSSTYHGLEIDNPKTRNSNKATHFYDGTTFPLPSQYYDCVICSQVLEHSPDPSLMLSEISRVLSPGGLLLLSIPFMWPEHEQPFDFQRLTTFNLRCLLENSGFKVHYLTKANPGLSSIIQLFLAWIESVSVSLLVNKYLFRAYRIAATPLFSLLNTIAYLNNRIQSRHPTNTFEPSFFLDIVILASKYQQ